MNTNNANAKSCLPRDIATPLSKSPPHPVGIL
jgi:hypothetical protein